MAIALDGLSPTCGLRELERNGALPRRPPFVALTANASVEDGQRCRAAGMDGFVAKPVCLQQPRDAIQGHTRADPERAVAD